MANPIRLNPPVPLTPVPTGRDLELARYAVFNRSPFTRSMARVLARSIALRDEIARFHDVAERTSLYVLWAVAGLPPVQDDDREAGHLLDTVEEAPGECSGFAWGLERFISFIESNVTTEARNPRRRTPAGNDVGEADDVQPDQVAGPDAAVG